jgi:anti-sigma factor RsiW
MDGRHLDGELVAYLRGELTPEAHARARRHLDGCRQCSATLAAHGELLDRLAHGYGEPPPVHWGAYRAELRQKLERRRHARWLWWPGWLPLSVSAAVAAVLLLVTLYATRPSPDHRELTAFEETVIGRRLEIINDAPLVENLDLLEDLDIIRQLDRVAPTAEG